MKGAFKFSILLAGAALLCVGAQTTTQGQDDAGVREAIRFEHAKDAADARQARIEAAKAHQGMQEANRVDTSKSTMNSTKKPSPMSHPTKTRSTDKTDK